jgi:hypothetical protein
MRNITYKSNIQSTDEVMRHYEDALANRTTCSTLKNATSSRSHFIFQIQFEGKRDGDVPSSGRLTFIDLAGSEAGDVAKNKKQEQEGKNIRNSLSALKTYLLDRAKGNSSSVSFRSSKLSFMMKGVLKQDAKVLVIANISPCADSFSQTKEALDFVENIAKLKSFQKRLGTCQYNENIECHLQDMINEEWDHNHENNPQEKGKEHVDEEMDD